MLVSCTQSDLNSINDYSFVDDEYSGERKIIDLSVLQYEYFTKKNVEAFNEQSDEYVVHVKAYIDFTLQEAEHTSITDARNLLNLDLMAGNYPDIILFDPFTPRQNYINKSLFVDLYSLMEADTGFYKEDYLKNAFAAAEQDGKLYDIFTLFHIRTLCAKTSAIGDTQGWTLDEFINYVEARPDVKYPISYITNIEFVQTMSQLLFIDSKTASVNFDRNEFQNLLEIAKRFPPENPSVLEPAEILIGMRNDDPLIGAAALSAPWQVRLWEQVYLREDMTTIGYPQVDKATVSLGGSYFFPEEIFAIFEQARNKEGAWEFLKFMLSTNRQFGIPIKMSLISDMLDSAKMEENSLYIYIGEGNEKDSLIIDIKEGTIVNDGQYTKILVGNNTDEDNEKFMNIIQSTNRVMRHDEIIENIISEEVANYYSGQISSDKTVDNIENRIGLYLSET